MKNKIRANAQVFVLIIVFLAGLAVFCVYKYAGVNMDLNLRKKQLAELEQRNTAITRELEEEKTRLMQVSQEKQNLEQEVTLGKQNLEQLKVELAGGRQEIAALERAIEELTAENNALSQKESTLRGKIDALSSEKGVLEAKLGSIDELKQMLKDLVKAKKASRRKESRVKQIKTEKRKIVEEAEDNNRGYIIYQGRPTHKPKISIQVLPVNQSSH